MGMSALAKAPHRLPQRRRRGGRPVGDQQGKAVQQQVERARRAVRRGEGLGGAADLLQVAGARQTPGEHRRHPRGQVGVAGQVDG